MSSTENCFVLNEWDTLKKVVVGSAKSWGPTPSAEEAVDPKSREHILAGTYPTESDVQKELDAFLSGGAPLMREWIRPGQKLDPA